MTIVVWPMRCRLGVRALFGAVVGSVLLCACGAPSGVGGTTAQEDGGSGIVYKPATPQLNASGAAMVQQLFVDGQLPPQQNPMICGPFLWGKLQQSPHLAGLDLTKVVMMMPTANGTQPLEGRGIRAPEEFGKFWQAFGETLPGGPAAIRKLNPQELELYWAMIAWDIEEPVFVVELAGGRKFILDLSVNEDGIMGIFWFDELSGVGFKQP